MKKERILTAHPQGKKGVSIALDKYDQIQSFILKTLRSKNEIFFSELSDLAMAELSPTFEGKVLWYLVTVKLDLEAKKIIERIPESSPHRLRLCPEGNSTVQPIL